MALTTKKGRRIHVGNLPGGIGLTPAALAEFLSSAMSGAGLTIAPGISVVESQILSDGKYGFVEVWTLEE